MSPRDTQQVFFPSKASSAIEAPGTSGGKALEDSPEPVLFLLGSTSECPQSQIYKNIQPSALLLRQTVACNARWLNQMAPGVVGDQFWLLSACQRPQASHDSIKSLRVIGVQGHIIHRTVDLTWRPVIHICGDNIVFHFLRVIAVSPFQVTMDIKNQFGKMDTVRE